MIIKVIIPALIVVAVSTIGLAFNLIFRKSKKFPEISVGRNKEMRKLGLRCAKCEEMRNYGDGKNRC